MLSRLAFRNAQATAIAVRGIQTTAPTLSDVPPLKRPIYPAPVRHGFIPEGWFTFFYPKTGASGPYVFLTTFGTYLLSKEWYILEHEFYNGLSLLIIAVYCVKKFGPSVAAYFDNESDKLEKELNEGREAEIDANRQAIKNLELEKERLEGQKLVFEIKRQNILAQLEATYRERLMQVYSEVKKRLDYNAQVDTVERRIAQKHMVQWIVNSVLKSITPEQEKANLQQCIRDLESLAVKA